MRHAGFIAGMGFLLALSGCAGSQEEEETELGRSLNALACENALNVNALNVNALNVNALNVNALTISALSQGAMAAVQDPGPSGALSRELLQYTVGCALPDSQSLSFSWTDSQGVVHDETYEGQLGLAPEWASGPLSIPGQRWVSACLASRVNFYGVHVTLSSRGAHAELVTPTESEFAEYTKMEGAFWGDLFSPSPWLHACFFAPNVAHSRAMKRDCAVGHLNQASVPENCGMIHILGSCDLVCARPSSMSPFYSKCADNNGVTSVNEVITVFLQ